MGAIKRRRRSLSLNAPPRRRIFIRSEFTNFLSTPVPRLEITRSKGPTSMRDTVARLHFDMFERQTPAAPTIGSAAKIARPADHQFLVGAPYIAARIELLRLGVETHRAAFHERYVERRINEFAGQRDASCAATDDA